MQLKQLFKQLLSYLLNFGVSAFTDISIFIVSVFVLKPMLGSVIAITLGGITARILSSLVNFRLNKYLFNRSNKTLNRQFLFRYYFLWLNLLILSVSITVMITTWFSVNESIAKIIADCFLGIFSFFIQRKWVFTTNSSINKGILFRVLRLMSRCFVKRKVIISQEVFDKECILVGHHQNFYAPVSAFIWLPDTVSIWTISHLFTFKECYQKYYNYTFREKINLPKIISAILAFCCGVFIPAFLRSAKAIPVYRDSRDIINTFTISMKHLEQGKQILIFPDISYDSKDENTGDIYNGFLHLEKMYHSKQKEHLNFVPINFDKKSKSIVAKSSVCFLKNLPFREERIHVANEIRNRLNN